MAEAPEDISRIPLTGLDEQSSLPRRPLARPRPSARRMRAEDMNLLRHGEKSRCSDRGVLRARQSAEKPCATKVSRSRCPRRPAPVEECQVNRYSLSQLSDQTLLRDLTTLLARDRTTTAALLAHLAEVDARKLYLPAGYPSMYTGATRQAALRPGAVEPPDPLRGSRPCA